MDRGKDSSSGPGNLLIRFARSALGEFIGAASGKKKMRVRIDKAGEHDASVAIDDGCVFFDCNSELVGPAHPCDYSVLDENRSVLHDPKLTHLPSRFHALAVRSHGDELANVFDQELQMKSSGNLVFRLVPGEESPA